MKLRGLESNQREALLQRQACPNLNARSEQEVTSDGGTACTPACYDPSERRAHPLSVEDLAAAILRLSAEEGARLVALILAGPNGTSGGR